ncbi:ThiF family adenylyltransferase [Alicyclobacillus shizuokensis]|uniref:ThiF family adenylyltransferase n=1 Tax=Alicyclobacillus shizuokensis TaxID=392014 RepID=UPI0008362076|nr:ThiF family adenylyltransferase [Alicyclobacillus shizuokensis]
MFHPVLRVWPRHRTPHHFHFDIVQVGAGGNGGYLTQRLAKMLYAFHAAGTLDSFRYCIVDGDRFESKNLLRQPCIAEDLGLPKSKVLAERYGTVYDIPVFYKESYVETPEDVESCFGVFPAYRRLIRILIGCVDNHASRQVMHAWFEGSKGTVVYIDTGVEAVLTEGSEEEIAESGYGGHVVCGVKIHGKTVLGPVGEVYPDILEDKDSRLPTQSCGQTVVDAPQRMQTNEMAALIAASYLNTILSSGEVVSHYTNFNARTALSRPVYLPEDVIQESTRVLH